MQFKLIVGAVVLVIIGSLYGFWRYSEAKNDALRNEIQALSVQVETQKATIDNIQQDMSLIQEEYDEYLVTAEENAKQAREAVIELTEKLDETLDETDMQILSDELSETLNSIFNSIGVRE